MSGNVYILDFSELSAADHPLVGGKGANLGELVRAGFAVPPGFCVTTAAFQQFMARASAHAVFAQLDQIAAGDVDQARQIGAGVRQQLRQLNLPGDVAAAVLTAWRAFGEEGAYAVRSSATAEDLPEASFAGQQDTYLNVYGATALLAAVRDCCVSLFTDRAIIYRLQNKFDHRAVQLCVIVQRMVVPDVSGVLFTADPLTNHRHIVAIDASFGLGEALVAGLVSADLYKIDKRNWQVSELKIADKQLAIRPARDGGTFRESLPGNLRHSQALSREQMIDLAQIGTRIEAHYGRPQDIEWAIENGAIYILQSRPITSLFPLPEPRPHDDALHVYASFNHAQVMTDPMPPMAHSVLRTMLPFGKDAADFYNPFMASAGGRLYLDLTPLLRHPLLVHLVPRALSIADPLIASGIRQVTSRAAFAAGRSQPASTRSLLRFLLPVLGRVVALLWFRQPELGVAAITRRIDTVNQECEARTANISPGVQRLHLARQLLHETFRDQVGQLAPYIASGIVARILLARLLAGAGDAADLIAVQRGLSGNVTTEMDLLVGDLADIARQSPELAARLLAVTNDSTQDSHDYTTHLREVTARPGGQEFWEAWQHFLYNYGMRGPGEIDISRPRWNDDPTFLLQVIIGNLQTSIPGAHRQRHGQLAAEGEAAAERLIRAANHGFLGPLRARVVRRLVRVVRGYLPTREHPKLMIIRVFGQVRAILWEEAAALVAAGRLDCQEDIWYLELPEVVRAVQDPGEVLRPRISQRRAEMERLWQLQPPRVITSDGEIPIARFSNEALPAGALPGNPVSAGVVEGIAHVILDPTREVLGKGEILVAPFTDPGWTPLFINAAGLVLEVGGMMTHGSVIAREYGIPAVAGVEAATTRLQTGQRIRVHGDKGYVEICAEGEGAAGADGE